MMPTSGSMWLPLPCCATTNSVAPAFDEVLDGAAPARGFAFALDWAGAFAGVLAELAFFGGFVFVCAAKATADRPNSSAARKIRARRERHTIMAHLPFSNRIVG